jgi:hypothetical protein
MATAAANRYTGEPGATRTGRVHVTCSCGTILSAEVYRTVDVSTHPELGQRLMSDDAGRRINTVTCPRDGVSLAVRSPVAYHDPDNAIFVLVIDEGQRHRELHERAALMAEIAADAGAPVPAYVRDVPAVFGRRGLEAYLEERVERALSEARRTEAEGELVRLQGDLDRQRRDLDDQRAELERMVADLERRGAEIDEQGIRLADREAALDRRSAELERETATLSQRATSAPVRSEPRPASAPPESRPASAPAESRPASAPPESRPASAPPESRPASARAGSRPAESAGARRAPAEAPRAEQPVRSGNGKPARPAFAHTEVDATPLPDPLPHHEAVATHPFELVPSSHEEVLEVEPEPLDEGEVVIADQVAAAGARPAEPVSTISETRINANRSDVAIERWIVSGEPSLVAVDDDGTVRVAISGDAGVIEPLLTDELGLRFQLHRLPSYPLVTLAIGPRDGFEGRGPRPYTLHLDLAPRGDRPVLASLAREFTLSLELFDREYLPVRSRTITTDLAENVAYLLSAAEAWLEGIEPRDRSFDRACVAYDNPAYDAFGLEHPERKELREDKLAELGTANQVRRALHIARRFTNPEREEYLLFLRGYPLPLWRKRRLAVVRRAVELGLWMGGPLAQIAVSEGLARSRKELVKALQSAFSRLCAGDPANDLDGDAIADNWAALRQEASALGLDDPGPEPPSPWSEEVTDSDRAALPAHHEPSEHTADLDPDDLEELPDEPMVSGTIGNTQVSRAAEAARGIATHNRSVQELLGLLEDKDRRLEAAVELARRGEERAIGPVFNVLRRMTRGEAVRVLGACTGFGDAATGHLLDGLRSRKGFLRQGCALALGVLANEEAIEALADLVLTEPTDIWREIARALGEVGAEALMPLLSRLQVHAPDHAPDKAERLAWTLAHIAARGGRRQVETVAGGRDPVAATTAGRGLELEEAVLAEDRQVREGATSRDQTVNRAFSRRFFQALAMVRPGGDLRDNGHGGVDASAPAMLLDEADLLEAADLSDADDEAEQLDESDLIPT